ncbi:bifunctional riboflavin kinase/FAD synthetase [Hanstruepera flava]|uniref:bifunctional riboflavin kinase/FAD synthetase n=1 Tax=Hanstruepera flava TaxID=2930218 RepID=UPI0020278A3A|nr:bifunctional riboflavin kinase/FAD synthetase [Hanstruepera flava]
MKIIQSSKSETLQNSVVTIGTFDGVHIGHQKIIKRLIDTAKKEGLTSVVLTFFPHPRMVLQNDADIKLINTIKERQDILDALGLDYLFLKQFTKDFSRWSAEDFVQKLLVNQLNAKKVIIGYDHHFGRNRSANIDDLKAFGEQYNFEVEEISAQDVNDVSVSSTKIRKALLEGDIATANSYLGYNFMLNGIVVKGKGLGKNIGYPTANLYIEETYKLIPKQGVYIVQSTISNKRVYGMMNIGQNPTVNASQNQNIEIHFFDFNRSIYNLELKIELLVRIRDEKKFDSIETLSQQLEQDKITSLAYIKNLDGNKFSF